MRRAGKISDVLGLGGASQLHLPGAKFTLRYLGDSEALVFYRRFRMSF